MKIIFSIGLFALGFVFSEKAYATNCQDSIDAVNKLLKITANQQLSGSDTFRRLNCVIEATSDADGFLIRVVTSGGVTQGEFDLRMDSPNCAAPVTGTTYLILESDRGVGEKPDHQKFG